MVKMKSIQLFLVLILLTAVLSACGGGGNKTESAAGAGRGGTNQNGQEKVKLVVQIDKPDKSDVNRQIIDKLVGDYMKENPNVTIELDTLNTDQQKLKLKTQAAANQLPDITTVFPGEQVKPYVDAGLLEPLDDILDKDGLRTRFIHGMLEASTFDGKVYELPVSSVFTTVFYNKKLFEQAGVQPPATFEELLDVIGKLKEKNITPMVIGEKEPWTGSLLFMQILARTSGGTNFLQDLKEGKKSFTDPGFVKAVDALQQLIQAGAFQSGVTSTDYPTSNTMFKTGKAAMIYDLTFFSSQYDTDMKGNISAFKFPTVGGQGDPNETLSGASNGFAVAKNGKHKDVAKDFLHYYFMHLPEVDFEMNNAGNSAQIIDKTEDELKAAGYSDFIIELMKIRNGLKKGFGAFDTTIEPTTTQVHLNSLQSLFVKPIDSEEIAKQHQVAWERFLSRKK
ncbi:extracellular solute-binding protein [Paenibacillus durus]|uniref:ABC transporter substrate-binding protein n=1 Tax=Paenibacillus durus ATCC 35681 TaxID=1333534 RepID=A0A0F7F7G2_PAEDU|nr:extracellular solute-binding protein [Paenibacillus durus]AKG33882.1 hypothetical protein VK70_04190 [Paenibacillus durus ATCC 35681]